MLLGKLLDSCLSLAERRNVVQTHGSHYKGQEYHISPCDEKGGKIEMYNP